MSQWIPEHSVSQDSLHIPGCSNEGSAGTVSEDLHAWFLETIVSSRNMNMTCIAYLLGDMDLFVIASIGLQKDTRQYIF